MIERLKRMIKSTDFFYSTEMLRYQDELEYRTLTGGFLSIAIIITTVIGFASMILQTLDLSSITSEITVTKNADPSYVALTAAPGNNFMFAVEVWKVNMTGPIRYFDVTLQQEVIQGLGSDVFTSIPLEGCTRTHWKDMPEVLDKFEQLGVANWLCPPLGLTLQLYGKYSSNVYSNYLITVGGCSNQTDPTRPCAPQQEIDALFEEFEQFFYFTFYYINPVINSDRKDFKSYYLEDENYVIFGRSMGTEAFVYFSDYTINTDSSIWPYESWASDAGAFVEGLSVNHPFQTVPNGKYAQICLAKSANSITYVRQVQKISSVFSFIGGMIGAVSAVLFVVKIYTNLAFEISIALSIFQPDRNSAISKNPLTMNLFTFVKYYIYGILKWFGKVVSWPDMTYINECQEEISKQLDIKALVKRIIFIEHCLSFVFQDYELEGLQLKRPTRPAQIKRIRQKYESDDCAELCTLLDCTQNPGKTQKLVSDEESVSEQEKNTPTVRNGPTCFSSIAQFPNLKSGCETPQVLVDDIMSNNEPEKQVKADDSMFRHKTRGRNAILPAISNAQRISRLSILNEKAIEGREISKKIWHTLSSSAKAKILKNCVNYNQDFTRPL